MSVSPTGPLVSEKTDQSIIATSPANFRQSVREHNLLENYRAFLRAPCLHRSQTSNVSFEFLHREFDGGFSASVYWFVQLRLRSAFRAEFRNGEPLSGFRFQFSSGVSFHGCDRRVNWKKNMRITTTSWSCAQHAVRQNTIGFQSGGSCFRKAALSS